jgi:diguanylate cyclase (GGDEF)-like protein
MEDTVFAVRRDEVRITVSIGISSFPKDGRSAAELLKVADSNLYKAKESGRNRVCPNF